MRPFYLFALLVTTISAIEITVDIDSGQTPISPALYGRNNCIQLAGGDATTEAQKQIYRDANVRLMREHRGNNSTKYNWKNGLSSHPDWYNNVYPNNWDDAALVIENEFDSVSAMFGFSAIGWAASSDSVNFNGWINDPSQLRTTENLCGDGDINKYLTPWPADSVVGIIDHWFGAGGLGLTESRFTYWNIDNEPDIWENTHDDVVTSHMHPDTLIDKYLTVARKIKSINPDFKLCGPAFTGEWHFWGFGLEDDLGMSFAEYFIKRFGEATTSDGVQLIDLIDVHFYFPYAGDATAKTELLQYHRLYYDREYDYPHANGVRTSEGGWDTTLTKEYLFARVETWIDKYFPANNTVSVGISESGLKSYNSPAPNHIALWYASQLGTFADYGTELYTPWYWYPGQWEVLNLFSNYHYATRVSSTSSNDSLVSAYSAINDTKDSLSVILVNRDENLSQSITLDLKGGKLTTGDSIVVMTLANLPVAETFVSATNNALNSSMIVADNDSLITITLAPLSITRLGSPLDNPATAINSSDSHKKRSAVRISQNNHTLTISRLASGSTVSIINLRGQKMFSETVSGGTFSKGLSSFSRGMYILNVKSSTGVKTHSFTIE